MNSIFTFTLPTTHVLPFVCIDYFTKFNLNSYAFVITDYNMFILIILIETNYNISIKQFLLQYYNTD